MNSAQRWQSKGEGCTQTGLEDERFPLHIPDPDFDSSSDTYENALFGEGGDDGMVA